MKILFITSSSINGGAQKHIRDMFLGLSREGNDVYLVAPTGWLLDELSEYANCIRPMASTVKNIKKLSCIMDEIKPDVTNTFILSGGCFGVVAYKKSKYGKIFVTVNNPIIYDGISTIRKIVYPYLYRWMSHHVSAFLVKSDSVSDEVSAVIKGKKPIVSIKNGIDFSVFDKTKNYEDMRQSLGIHENDVVVTAVAVLNERKGQRYLIEAVYKLWKKHSGIHLLLAGEGPNEAALKQQVKEAGVEGIVHFLGGRSDINRVLANSDIFVLSSLHEGLPNALMEAMAMGLPCIATDVGGVRQLIDNGKEGIIIKPKSAQQIEESLDKMMADWHMAAEYGAAACERIYKEYRKETVTEELKQIYLSY